MLWRPVELLEGTGAANRGNAPEKEFAMISLRPGRRPIALAALFVLATGFIPIDESAVADVPSSWKAAWPKTDFSNAVVDLSSIRSGGPPKDGIPSIDKPQFTTVGQAAMKGLAGREPVVSVVIGDEARAYPLRILMWHEIVNDSVGGTPVSVTYCPLCNSAVVLDRRLDGKVLDFGTTGKLRNSDMVMYDRQTESWWQQFLGKGIVGKLAGKKLRMLPMRLESFERFAGRYPGGKVLIPTNEGMRAYGRNPYYRYDSRSAPYFPVGSLPAGVPPLERVVVIGRQAWTFSLLREKRKVIAGEYIIVWEKGQASALDSAVIRDGRDVGNIVVQRKGARGQWRDAVHDVSFAFAFHAFHPDGKIHSLAATQ